MGLQRCLTSRDEFEYVTKSGTGETGEETVLKLVFSVLQKSRRSWEGFGGCLIRL
jgi:hypothetical protein